MKVQLSAQELRDVLRQIHTCRDDTVMLGGVEMQVLAEEASAHEPQFEALPPQERIRRNPGLALDSAYEYVSLPCLDEVIQELLSWFHRPEAARGRSHYVPHGHPSGLGGCTIYVPDDFPLPDETGYEQQRIVSTRLTVQFAGKEWDASQLPGVRVGQHVMMDFDDDGAVQASYYNTQDRYVTHRLTETRVD